LFIISVPAGFPSPAANFAEGPLDLNRYLIHHPAATFFVRVIGDSMIGVGIYPNDHCRYQWRPDGKPPVSCQSHAQTIGPFWSESLPWPFMVCEPIAEWRIDWRFTTKDAHIKLKRLYPSVNC
jgi:hypothetical protein